MNEHELNEILDAAWRRPLTEAEEATVQDWAVRYPDQRAEIESVLTISRSLQQLPEASVPSNFMSRVWQEIDASEQAESKQGGFPVRAGGGSRLWHLWLPRFATGLAAVAIAGGGWWRYEAGQRAFLVHGIEAAADATEPLEPAMLREFEAIQILGQSPASVDVELLAALQ